MERMEWKYVEERREGMEGKGRERERERVRGYLFIDMRKARKIFGTTHK